ncbi:MAG: outer membrane beta-barrel protein [Bacteroidota bacterium]
MGKFEDQIRSSFEGKKVAAPRGAWSAVENQLNAEFVAAHQRQNFSLHWSVAASLLLLFGLAALFYNPIYVEDVKSTAENKIGENSKVGTYNALLQGSYSFSLVEKQTAWSGSKNLATFPTFITGGAESLAVVLHNEGDQEVHNAQAISQPTLNLPSRTPALKEALVTNEIYPYHQGGGAARFTSRSKNVSIENMWAGLEAGAGNFGSSVTSSNVFVGSIDQENLATALGSDGFVNPNTEINSDLSRGVATSLGVDFGVRLGNRWTLETGLAYTNVSASGDASINVLDIYTVNDSQFLSSETPNSLPNVGSTSRETSFEVQENYDYDLDLRSSVRFTSVPVKAGYYLLDRKMKLRLNLGLSANYFMSSQVSAENDVLTSSIDNSFNTWSFDGMGGVELGYSLFNNFDLTLEPNYRQSITPLTDQNIVESRFLLQTGLRYTLR